MYHLGARGVFSANAVTPIGCRMVYRRAGFDLSSIDLARPLALNSGRTQSACWLIFPELIFLCLIFLCLMLFDAVFDKTHHQHQASARREPGPRSPATRDGSAVS